MSLTYLKRTLGKILNSTRTKPSNKQDKQTASKKGTKHTESKKVEDTGVYFSGYKDIGVRSAMELDGALICATKEQFPIISRFFKHHNLQYETVIKNNISGVITDFVKRQCDTFFIRNTTLNSLPEPEKKLFSAFQVLPEYIE